MQDLPGHVVLVVRMDLGRRPEENTRKWYKLLQNFIDIEVAY